jgi:phage tail sheath protein FI
MPEYLAPGVYVEEVSFRSKSIEGVSTTTTGFVGPTRYGPLDLEPELLTSVAEFERIYGDGQPLVFSDAGRITNFMWHAVRAFFEEGGKRLYVVRTYHRIDKTKADEGCASAALSTAITVRARFPGAAGKMRVALTVQLGQNVLGSVNGRTTLGAVKNHDVVWIADQHAPHTGALYQAQEVIRDGVPALRFSDLAASPTIREVTDGSPPDLVGGQHRIHVLTLTVAVLPADPDALPMVWKDLPLDPRHERRAGVRDGVSDLFAQHPPTLAQARSLPIVIDLDPARVTGMELVKAIDAQSGGKVQTAIDRLVTLLDDPDLPIDVAAENSNLSTIISLDGGSDGPRPTSADYEGEAKADSPSKTGLKALEDLDDISIVAAPGSTYMPEGDESYESHVRANLNALITHATNMRYRIAVLDSKNDLTLQAVREQRSKIDSKYAAFYYPWVRIVDPITGREANMPPSGFVAGIYARNDIQRAVYKAPANEVVNLAVGFEKTLNKAQQDVLNPEGINCFRFFEGRGFRLWGARTISSDPEWKYVNLRRYFIYLEHSIDKGTQWAVFEPNGENLWANIRRTVEDFLFNEWQMGALLGDKPEKAFFVKCDRTTMTQNDLDNGRLVCLVGVAPLRPAEFVIFRIGQWTADRRV